MTVYENINFYITIKDFKRIFRIITIKQQSFEQANLFLRGLQNKMWAQATIDL